MAKIEHTYTLHNTWYHITQYLSYKKKKKKPADNLFLDYEMRKYPNLAQINRKKTHYYKDPMTYSRPTAA